MGHAGRLGEDARAQGRQRPRRGALRGGRAARHLQKPEADAGAEEEAKGKAEGRVKEELPEANAQLLSFPKVEDEPSQGAREEDVEEAKQTLEQDPAVEAVDYNYLRRAGYAPDDPRFGEQYGLEKPGLPRAWDRTRGSPETKIAVVDSGADAEHPDLQGKVSAQEDFVDGDDEAQDDYGHGTHVAGIAAANTGNGEGVAGGCPDCALLVAKVLGPDGGGTVADLVEGIRWAADNGAKAINLSVGGPGKARAEERAVEYAWEKGAVVVAAAGNVNSDKPEYPAAYDRAMAVAATDARDRRAPISDYGKWVDVAAPGVNIVSTVPGGGYRSLSGTSMASPHVAALAGLLASRGRTNAEIRKQILGTAVDLGKVGRDPYYGSGRIDATRAVRGEAQKR